MTAVAERAGSAVEVEGERVGRFAWLRERGMGATILVSAISVAFGVFLISATRYLALVMSSTPTYGTSDTLAMIVAILGMLLLAVAVYVAAIVTSNTFATIVAGRTRRIALMRLIGASARSQRSEIARQGLAVGAIGSAVGLGLAIAAVAAGLPLVDVVLGQSVAGEVGVQPAVVLPAVAVTLTTWAASWIGARRVLTVTPLQALGGSVEQTHEEVAGRRGRNAVTLALGAVGVALLVGGLLVGLVSPLGVIVAFFGGLLSFTALSLSAAAIMPPLLRLTGRVFGRSTTARLAAQNALRYPERSSRMAIGVVMGVALVTMFGVAAESAKVLVNASGGGEPDVYFSQMVDAFAGVMMGLVAVSAVIAGVGLVNLLTIGVVQRRRELGLLRALGLTTVQVRRMVLLEAAHVTITALAFGLVWGTVYGWIAAQSVLGSVPMPPSWMSPTFVLPAVPLVPTLIVALATAVLTLVAAVVPTRLATRATPVEALAE